MEKTFYCICKNPESEAYHVFVCKLNLLTKKCYFVNTTSICKSYILASDHSCVIDCMSAKEAREECAILANKGQLICPECVSNLYR